MSLTPNLFHLSKSAMAALLVRLAVSLVAVKAESDCSSLLMSKQRSSIEFQDGKCIEQDGDRRTKTHENVVKFEALDSNGEFSSLTFQPSWYSVTAGQPVASDCLKVDSTSITFTAGRKGSGTTAGVFMQGFNDTTVYGIYAGGCLAGPALLDSPLEVSKGCLALCSPGHPDELNFVFEGTATFNFNIDGKVFSSSLVLRFGQGHQSSKNNWWIGNDQCFRVDTKDGSGVVCGPLLFREFHGNNVFGVAYVKRSFQSNSCLHESGSSHDSTHDNMVTLESREGQSFSLSFDPSWYAVTVGQPVAASCLTLQGGTFTFSAGRRNSNEAALVFMKGNSGNSIIGPTDNGGSVGSGTPSELNFALEGNATFTFKDAFGRVFSGSHLLRLGQGHKVTLWVPENNWWLGAPGCYQKSCINCHKCDCKNGGLVCGELYFQTQSAGSRLVVMPESWMT